METNKDSRFRVTIEGPHFSVSSTYTVDTDDASGDYAIGFAIGETLRMLSAHLLSSDSVLATAVDVACDERSGREATRILEDAFFSAASALCEGWRVRLAESPKTEHAKEDT